MQFCTWGVLFLKFPVSAQLIQNANSSTMSLMSGAFFENIHAHTDNWCPVLPIICQDFIWHSNYLLRHGTEVECFSFFLKKVRPWAWPAKSSSVESTNYSKILESRWPLMLKRGVISKEMQRLFSGRKTTKSKRKLGFKSRVVNSDWSLWLFKMISFGLYVWATYIRSK